MSPRRRHSFSGLAAIALALSACQSSTEPSGQQPPEQPPPVQQDPSFKLSVIPTSITALEPCEEAFTDFDGGEFGWSISVTWPDGSSDKLDETSGYPAATGYQKLAKNTPRKLAGGSSGSFRSVKDMTITVTLRGTEFDFDLFGNNPGPDSRMRDSRGSRVTKYDGFGWPQGDHEIIVRPDPACSLRLNYTVAAVKE